MKLSADTLDLAHSSCKDGQGEITTISTRSVLPAVATPSCLLRQACPQAWAELQSGPVLLASLRLHGAGPHPGLLGQGGHEGGGAQKGGLQGGVDQEDGEEEREEVNGSRYRARCNFPLMLQSLTLESSPANCHSSGCIHTVVVVIPS